MVSTQKCSLMIFCNNDFFHGLTTVANVLKNLLPNQLTEEKTFEKIHQIFLSLQKNTIKF